MKIYLVGGAVRDTLLNRPIKERDYVVVGSTVDEMLAQGFKPVGKAFPVFLHPKTKEEYALARTEKKVGQGYHGFTFYTSPDVTLEEDLKRRDFTINAIAQDKNNALIDPYGGTNDCEARILKHVSDAFVEDPVRLLRAARFLARFHYLGFTLAPETLSLMKEMVKNGEVDALVPERVFKEMQLALCEPTPSIFFETLRECGALKILFPWIDALFGVPQNPEHHPEIDCGIHTMMVLDATATLTPDPVTRFAALTHDLGKGQTDKSLLPKHPGHEAISAQLVDTLCERYRIPNDYHDMAKLVALYHGLAHKALSLDAEQLLVLLEGLDVFRRPQRLKPFLTACEGDSRGRLNFENTPYPQAERIRDAFEAANNIDTKAIANSHQGEAIKRAIREARESAISHRINHN